jgi:hypothetical protein
MGGSQATRGVPEIELSTGRKLCTLHRARPTPKPRAVRERISPQPGRESPSRQHCRLRMPAADAGCGCRLRANLSIVEEVAAC